MKLPTVIVTEPRIDHTAAGLKIRFLRLSRNISLRTLAERLDISAPYLSDLERGRRNWSQDTFNKAVLEIGKVRK